MCNFHDSLQAHLMHMKTDFRLERKLRAHSSRDRAVQCACTSFPLSCSQTVILSPRLKMVSHSQVCFTLLVDDTILASLHKGGAKASATVKAMLFYA